MTTDLEDLQLRDAIRRQLITEGVIANVDHLHLRPIADASEEFDLVGGKLHHRETKVDFARWLADHAPKRWPTLAPPQASAPSTEPNPFDELDGNITKAMQLEATNPAKAKELAIAAGHASLDDAYDTMARRAGEDR